MQRSFLRSKNFQRLFFTYVALFAAMIFISILLLAQTTQKERDRAAAQQRSLQAEKIAAKLDDMWAAAGSVGEALNRSPWVEKYKADTDVFDGEFSLVKQNEISQSLQTFCIANTVIRDIGILYPRKGVVITPHGWFEQQEYQSFVNDQLLIDGESFLNTVAEMPGGFARLYPDDFAKADPNNLVYISQLDVLESPRAVAIIYLDKSVISEQLRQVCDSLVSGIRIRNDRGQERMTVRFEEPASDTLSLQLPSQNMLLSYEIEFQVQSTPFMQGAGGYLVILGVAVLSTILAYALAKLQYSPINSLLSKLKARGRIENRKEDVDAIAFCIDNLFDDNATLKTMVSSYQQQLNQQWIIQLLRGVFSDDLTALVQGQDGLFIDTFAYSVLVLQRMRDDLESASEEAQGNARFTVILQQVAGRIAQEQNHCEIAEHIDGNTAIIIEFPSLPDKELVMGIAESVHAALMEQDIECCAYVGRPCRGLAGISTSYQAAMEMLQSRRFQRGVVYAQSQREYYYPIEWESQLVRAMREGNIVQARSILRHLYEENHRLQLSKNLVERVAVLLSEDLYRTAISMDLPAEKLTEKKPSGNLEQVFAAVDKAVEAICTEAARRKEEATDTMNRSLVDYVNAHIFDPGLSLKQLGDVFSVSTASVSRIFKKSAGENFYHYITTKRIDRAQELLRVQGYYPAQIAEAVGYDSEYSFKRAFLRIVGVHPREYAARPGAELKPGGGTAPSGPAPP